MYGSREPRLAAPATTPEIGHKARHSGAAHALRSRSPGVPLREYVARGRRLEALGKLAARAQRGEFDQAEAARLAEKAAWREALA
ncbi:hypothetical protein GCM10022224_027950 [Nonomuraea antimicrobica]|uniref:Uncharacterized protein n=1 Tax=Nonomuraea antimicrobica TaxID=561173 RepID=A0ABP7BL79_9ACTN